MTCLEYLNKITDDCTRCKFTDSLVTAENNGTEDLEVLGLSERGTPTKQVKKFVNITLYKQASVEKAKKLKEEAKRDELILERVTHRAFMVQTDNASVSRFYKQVMKIVPQEYRNGEYDYEEWLEWLTTFQTFCIGDELLTKSLSERHLVGGRQCWNMMTKRFDVLQERANERANTTEDVPTTINFHLIGGDDGST